MAFQPPSPVSYDPEQPQEAYGLVRSMGRSIGHVMFDQKPPQDMSYSQGPDTAWRGLRRRERALESDIQRLLDSQVAGLISGSQTEDFSLSRELDAHSDAGSSTPTGTFYSTATSRSQMPRSLYIPPTSTADGNVIPVRQPAKTRPPGLKSARHGLRRTIISLIELRQEESDQIDTSIDERRNALAQLNKLGTRRLGIQSELAAFDGDDEEPLGKQLRELEGTYGSVNQEISMLEEKLMSLRNQRRWLRDKMDDVKGKREAGLSGYRGALKELDSELTRLVRRPPILPLDPAVFKKNNGGLGEDVASSGGVEFLRLIPERRTPELAKSWWEAELEILEKRRTQVDEERLALEQGAALWKDVISLVSDFESELRRVLKGGISTSKTSAKGKEKAPSEKELIETQLKNMSRVLAELQEAMRHAEANSWNLLICAIGAELEAFQEGHDVLDSLLHSSQPRPGDANESVQSIEREDGTAERHGRAGEESDNDVPPDLLVSHDEETDRYNSKEPHEVGLRAVNMIGDKPQSQDSENEVPLEFLAEHD